MQIWNTAYILEKNKLASDAPWLACLLIEHPSLAEPIRLVRNTENITWRGLVWTCFPMKFGNITQDGKETPQVELQISNLGGLIEAYIQKNNGFTDATVTIYVVHASHLDLTDAAYEISFNCESTKFDEKWVTFCLTCERDFNWRFPPRKYIQDFCPWKFKSIRCGYHGSAGACNGTLATCRIPERFGGEPGVESGQ